MTGFGGAPSKVVGMDRKEETKWDWGDNWSVKRGIFSELIKMIGWVSVLEYVILTEFDFKNHFSVGQDGGLDENVRLDNFGL